MGALAWLLSITLLSSLLIAVQTVSWQGLYSDPRHPGKCTINPQLVLNPGVSVKDPTRDCGQIVCGHMGQLSAVFLFRQHFPMSRSINIMTQVRSKLGIVVINNPRISLPAYPGLCVLDVGTTVVLLTFGETYKLKSLPCTYIFCTGGGYGLLYTCEKKPPPDGCQFAEYTNWDDGYPGCCQRKVVCL
ncbi:hypothetical protein KR054_009088 [Drosophila jambulina]|nr:hypothetical protein KR054_009088 [Drosophila jambulina]